MCRLKGLGESTCPRMPQAVPQVEGFRARGRLSIREEAPRASPAPTLPAGSFRGETASRYRFGNEDEPPMNTNRDGPPSMTNGARMHLRYRDLDILASWEEAHPGARASRPHKSWYSLTHLLAPDRPATAPGLCFGRDHAVPAGSVAGLPHRRGTERQPKGQDE